MRTLSRVCVGILAFVAVGGPVAAQPVTANAPHPKTEAGLRCLLGLGPDGCWRRFETPYARQNIKYSALRCIRLSARQGKNIE